MHLQLAGLLILPAKTVRAFSFLVQIAKFSNAIRQFAYSVKPLHGQA